MLVLEDEATETGISFRLGKTSPSTRRRKKHKEAQIYYYIVLFLLLY